jgi:hypothetical protein
MARMIVITIGQMNIIVSLIVLNLELAIAQQKL